MVPSKLIPGNYDNVKFPEPKVNTVLRLHVHTADLDVIPSLDDVIGFTYMYNKKKALGATDAENVISITLSSDVYIALAVSDPVKLENFFKDYKDRNKIYANGQTFQEVIENRYNKIYKLVNDRAPGATIDMKEYFKYLREEFVYALKDFDCGIDIYAAIHTPDGNNNWTKIN